MKTLVAGWFSFEGMGATAGDLMTRVLACQWFWEASYAYDVAPAPGASSPQGLCGGGVRLTPLRRLVAAREMAAVPIDTRLDENSVGLRAAAEVESLDPVAGGDKVRGQADTIGWPVVFSAYDLRDDIHHHLEPGERFSTDRHLKEIGMALAGPEELDLARTSPIGGAGSRGVRLPPWKRLESRERRPRKFRGKGLVP